MRPVALFVDSRGIYPSLGIESWGVERDARTYQGNAPVIAHPPCQLWGNFAPINFKRWGGEHNRPGNDGGCFASALTNVRRCGGVLEHPAHSRAFAAHNLQVPRGIGWSRAACGGWVCEVWQSAYGHLARKRTWLYYHGVRAPLEARWERVPGTHVIGHDARIANHKPVLRGAAASATPRAFAEYLIALAEGSC